MGTVLQLSRTLTVRPEIAPIDGLIVRNYRGPEDIEPWLELRHRAFAQQRFGVRQWNAADFEAEFLTKPWWRPERLWLAEAAGQRDPALSTSDVAPRLVGSVAWAMRGDGPLAQPAVHWLAVLPRWRRRGVGRLLMSRLEAACWDAGHRTICLETHIGWSAAVRFYERLGYRERTG